MARRSKKQKAEQAASPVSDLLNDLQCAALLGVKPRTLRLWRTQRGLPHIKITSKEIRYRRSDIDGWLSRRLVSIGTA